MFYGSICLFIGEAQYFGEILPADPAIAFHSGGIRGITDVADCYDSVLVHLFFSESDLFLNDGGIKSSFGDNRAEEFDESGVRGDNVFEVTQL